MAASSGRYGRWQRCAARRACAPHAPASVQPSVGRDLNTSNPPAGEPVEDAHAAEPRRAQLPAQPARTRDRQRPARGEQARGFRRPRRSRARAPRRREAGAPQVLDVRPGLADHRQRNVQPALLQSHFQVLPEVGELQRRAHRVRAARRAVRRDSRRCAAPAARPDWPTAGSSRAGRPRSRSADTARPAGTRSADRRTAARSRPHRRIVSPSARKIAAGVGVISLTAAASTAAWSRCLPVVEQRKARGGRPRAFVGEIVGDPRERVDRGDVRPRRRGSSRDATGKFS